MQSFPIDFSSFGSPKGNTLGVRKESALLLHFCELLITRRTAKSER